MVKKVRVFDLIANDVARFVEKFLSQTSLCDCTGHNIFIYVIETSNFIIQGDQKVFVHMVITVQKVTSNVQSFLHHSPDIYRHTEQYSRRPCSV